MKKTYAARSNSSLTLLKRVKNSVKHRAAARLAALRFQKSMWRHLLSFDGRGKRILLIEDRVPHNYLGAGYPRSNFILRELVEMGYRVTLYPLVFPSEDGRKVYEDIPAEVEVMLDFGAEHLQRFLVNRKGYYDLIFVSRPHNMQTLLEALPRPNTTPIVYDAEALFCMRKIERARMEGQPLSPEEEQALIGEEVRLAHESFCVTSVSYSEARRFVRHGVEKAYTLSHAVRLRPTPNPFESRRDILFVGPVRELDSPNGDAVAWFIREIFPLIQERLGRDVKFLVVGPNAPNVVEELAGESIKFMGKVDDLTELYNHARLFVAPTRFSAGIPLKILEAVSYGLPVVATSLVGTQLDWKHEAELLLARDAKEFAAQCVRLYQDAELWNSLRLRALNRVGVDCSPEAFSARLKLIVQEAINAPASV
jgi:O-antigen biosynthesis protein